jgi:hypothetical protein
MSDEIVSRSRRARRVRTPQDAGGSRQRPRIHRCGRNFIEQGTLERSEDRYTIVHLRFLEFEARDLALSCPFDHDRAIGGER